MPSPCFTQTVQGAYGFDANIEGKYGANNPHIPKRNNGYIDKVLGDAPGVNQNGVSFLSRNAGSRDRMEESLHGIFNRINGQFNPYLSHKFLGDRNLYDRKNLWWEQVLVPFLDRLYP